MRHKEAIEKSCRLCEHATRLTDEQYCLCHKCGVVYSYGFCRKFRADLLKFTPQARVGIPNSTQYSD